MEAEVAQWEREFERWLAPFWAALGDPRRRPWGPVYVRGLLGPAERKSIQPLAARLAPDDYGQVHHFVRGSCWPVEPLERLLAEKARDMVGAPHAVLIIDDTQLLKKGHHSVGVALQYCGMLGTEANCQALVSLTHARGEVPVALALRLYLPESWASDDQRRREAKVPESMTFRTKAQIALAELDRLIAAGVRPGVDFGLVLADAGYGRAAEFRSELTKRGLTWAVGINTNQAVYPVDVGVRSLDEVTALSVGKPGRPRKYPVPSVQSMAAEKMIDTLVEELGPGAFQSVTWRSGTKGPLRGKFAVMRVRVADGPLVPSRKRHLPGEALWLVCERLSTGGRKYYLGNLGASTPAGELIRAIKARWACEQAHQQMKEELGLDHFEGRTWLGLHHHVLLTMISFAFLQHLRLREVEARVPARERGRGENRERTRRRRNRDRRGGTTTRAITAGDPPRARA
ncbi:MAG: IS701 family transposase [Gemmatimonadaceae bacterium]